MGDWGDWATLFKNFIYRDVAFILGGSIVLGSFAYSFDLSHLICTNLSVPVVILFAALAYVVGYGVQDIGGVFRISTTAVPYKPTCGGRCLYKVFTRLDWTPVDYAQSTTPIEFEIEMGRQNIPPRTLQALDRILSLKVISMCIGACLIVSAIFIAVHWFRSGAQSHGLDEVVASSSFLLFGIALICLGRLKAMQEMQFYQAMSPRSILCQADQRPPQVADTEPLTAF
jgi:hypothetical protein